MRILILNSWYYPNLMGGAEHSVMLLAEHLAQRGYVVGVFTIDSEIRQLSIETINGVKIFRGSGGMYNIRKAYRPNKPLVESLRNKWLEIRNYSIVSELSKVNTLFKPDLVHVNCIAGMSMSAIKYFQLKQIPIVYTLRDYFLDNPRNIVEKYCWNHPIKKILLSVYRWYTRRISSQVDACTAPSTYTLKYYLDNGYFSKSKIKECIFNSVPINIENTKECIDEKRTHLKRNFMYAGSVTETKGIIPMLTAFMQTNMDCNLYICGTGDLLEYVKGCSIVDSRIKVLGKLKPAELELIYRKSDIMLVPSLWAEPFGRVVIEAAKYGLYVIGSKNGGIPEIIETLKCGCICNPIEINIFKEILEKVYIKDFSDCYNNIVKQIDRYSIERQIDSFEKVYVSLLTEYKTDKL